MSVFPETIKIYIVDIKTKNPLEEIVVMLHIFANHKNDYYLIPQRSNSNGEIIINKDWVNKEIEDSRNLFIMDYGSTIEDCKPYVDISIMDSDSINRAIEAMKRWQSILSTPEEEIDNLKKAKNAAYKPVSKIVQFNGSDVLEVILETQKIH